MKSQEPNSKRYDLEERTAKFAERVIELMQKLPENSINKRMIEQCVASSILKSSRDKA